MIREPYGVFPYNTTIDTGKENDFSLIFNGDELESYSYEILENNSGGAPLYKSGRIDNPNIYNEDELNFVVGKDESLKGLVGKNLLWKITMWENNANYKLTEPKGITQSTAEVAATTIYLQDENQLLSSLDFSKKELIVNLSIRGERRRIINYNSANHSVTISNRFSFLPRYGGGYTDEYILFGNFPTTNKVATYAATIPILNGITTDPSVYAPSTNTSKAILTGVIPVLNGITDNKLQNEVVVTLAFGSTLYRVKEYWQWDVIYDITKDKVVNDKQLYNIQTTRNIYHSGTTIQKVETLTGIEDISFYQEHDSDVGAYCIVDKDASSIQPDTPYIAYRNYYESNYFFFKSREKAILSIVNFPTEQANAFPSRFYRFQGSYQQSNNIPIKYHVWEVYDISKIKPIYTTEKQFNSNLIFDYDDFRNYTTYQIKLIVENQEGARAEYLSPQIIVSYRNIDFKTSGEAIYNKLNYSADITWPDNRLSIPTLVEGADGTFTDFFNGGLGTEKNLTLPFGTHYRYDNLSGAKMVIDSSDFMLSAFFAIDDPPEPWNGNILSLESNTGDNRITLIKEGYWLRLICDDGTPEGLIIYNFYKGRKIEEGEFEVLTGKENILNLLKIKSGQQQGTFESGAYRPLNKDEKLGLAFEWMENDYATEQEIDWTQNYFWTETTSDTNELVYKLLLYPNRAELYPMLRWKGITTTINGTSITVGRNRLLGERTNKTVLQIGTEIRTVTNYDYSTGIITVDSPFSITTAKSPFLCYYENGENDNKDNIYVCEFTQRNSVPFNQLHLYGATEFNYIYLFSTSYFEAEEIHNMLYYDYILNWTDDNQNSIILNLNFNGSLSSKYFEGIETTITGYRLYRNTYYKEEDEQPFESILVAEITANEIQVVNNTFLRLTDFSIRNRGIFNYTILPMTNTVVGVRIETNKIKTSWYEWIFTSLGRIKDNIYHPNEQWVFKLNLEAGPVTHNTNKVFHQGLSKYPKVSIGRTNYITTSLTCLVSDLQYETIYKDDYLIPIASGNVPYPTIDIDNRKIYIQPTTVFDDINLQEKKAFIFINKQERRINFFGTEWVDNIKCYFIIIEEPFKFFMPSPQNPLTNHYTIYANYLPDGVDETQIIQRRKIIFTDSIERINSWNRFINTDEPILVRDMKGNSFIGVISNSNEQLDIRIDDFPTTINFNITQIADANSYLVFDT